MKEAMLSTLLQISKRNFSKNNEIIIDRQIENTRTLSEVVKMNEDLGKEKRAKIIEDNLMEVNWPYYIQNEDKSVDIPINCLDCIRIQT